MNTKQAWTLWASGCLTALVMFGLFHTVLRTELLAARGTLEESKRLLEQTERTLTLVHGVAVDNQRVLERINLQADQLRDRYQELSDRTRTMESDVDNALLRLNDILGLLQQAVRDTEHVLEYITLRANQLNNRYAELAGRMHILESRSDELLGQMNRVIELLRPRPSADATATPDPASP